MQQAQRTAGCALNPDLGRRARLATPRGRPARRCPRCRGAAPASLPEASVFRPPLVDIGPALRGEPLPPETVEQVRRECESTGFLALRGHGLDPSLLSALFSSAAALFDLPLADKEALAVAGMKAGRGWEVSPEHREAMAAFARLRAAGALRLGGGPYGSGGSGGGSSSGGGIDGPVSSSGGGGGFVGLEPSAAEGILSERFLCGPALPEGWEADPYYSSGLGPVFFAPDAWPPEAAAPGLRARMRAAHAGLARVGDAALAVMAEALGLPAAYFEPLTRRACSNLQVAHYPSQPVDPALLGAPELMRKKAHTDSGLLTLLASEDWWGPGGGWRPGDGGVQLLNSEGRWVEVAVPQGALLLNLGSLLTRITNGAWKSTLHRVTNPRPRGDAEPLGGGPEGQGQSRPHDQQQQQQNQQQQDQQPSQQPQQQHCRGRRRLSVALFHKPGYDQTIDVAPTCLGPGGARRYEAARASDLTRAGLLHRFAHLPPAEASRRYHEEMARTRAAAE
ncbi:hypothetical protein Rsub_06291 [Raphidocelis subcapitata]|uniref:Fe2OG dioxygenase domain-containing protein n=1 Tax=Raphidocelis subcapitata TaxID=307507 RepID=A0A2V0P119_9CHLO|nr:hypothetical protein Rsub_06291 [Raphidocelis subcapitata]|eukprot:GBF93571.1 hypothetical protein Rsub_06291 [Raphidocelis subcapitata]